MSFNIEVEGGSSVRLPTAGKYCDRDIVITALGGGGGGPELLFETTFSVAESQIDVGNVTIATIQTGLTKADWGDCCECAVVIECINDTELDFSKRHWVASVGRVYCSETYALTVGSPYHFSKSETQLFAPYYYEAGAFVNKKTTTKWLEKLTINTNSAYYSAWGIVPSGDYKVKIFKCPPQLFGLEVGSFA